MGVMPCVIRIAAIAIVHAATTAPAARRILTLARDLLMGGLGLGLLGLMLHLGLDVRGDGLLAGNPNHVM
jgi:hypothetical protein